MWKKEGWPSVRSRKVPIEVIKAVREATKLPVIAKLSPNVANIQTIAEAAASAGADAISLINTLLGMASTFTIINRISPHLRRSFGGPAIKPVGPAYGLGSIPGGRCAIIGMGGINTWQDAVDSS